MTHTDKTTETLTEIMNRAEKAIDAFAAADKAARPSNLKDLPGGLRGAAAQERRNESCRTVDIAAKAIAAMVAAFQTADASADADELARGNKIVERATYDAGIRF